ncbi:hypothetical protein ACFS32_02835 [Novosphingobium pokkalii]|uniref:hypothetical protein n=1 Tax=Novosphingobium pokkalii TaxID=1770194 RepID=UPI00363BC179
MNRFRFAALGVLAPGLLVPIAAPGATLYLAPGAATRPMDAASRRRWRRWLRPWRALSRRRQARIPAWSCCPASIVGRAWTWMGGACTAA